jgi:hypothetical protein
MSKSETIPSEQMKLYRPGSLAAYTAGCLCDADANKDGSGYKFKDGQIAFVVACVCPLHGQDKPSENYAAVEYEPKAKE